MPYPVDSSDLSVQDGFKFLFTNMTTWHARISSFKNGWTGPVDMYEMARAGLTYTGVDDLTKCEFCGVSLHKWTSKDDPFEDHKRYSPKCEFVNKVHEAYTNDYCCKNKCFPVPSCQVDGRACSKCYCFSYCKCRCITFKNNGGALLMELLEKQQQVLYLQQKLGRLNARVDHLVKALCEQVVTKRS